MTTSGSQLGDARTKGALGILRGAIDLDHLDPAPGPVRLVRRPLATTEDDDLVPEPHQLGNEVCTDMTGATDDDCAHGSSA